MGEWEEIGGEIDSDTMSWKDGERYFQGLIVAYKERLISTAQFYGRRFIIALLETLRHEDPIETGKIVPRGPLVILVILGNFKNPLHWEHCTAYLSQLGTLSRSVTSVKLIIASQYHSSYSF